MLVDWLVSFVRRSTRRGFGSCRVFFDVRFRSKKYAGHIFRTESEALAERPAEDGLEGQEPRGTRRVEDLNRGDPEAWRESGRRLFKPQTVLLRWRGLRGGGSKSGDTRHLVQEWSEANLGAPRRKRKERPLWGSTGRKSFLPSGGQLSTC